MPMFDDPRKELKRLQEQLLAEEEEIYPEEKEIREDFDEELDDILELLREEKEEPSRRPTVYRNYANNYGRPVPDIPVEDDGEEEGSALYADEYEPRKKKKKKEKGIRGLVFLAILETLGILAIAAWWVKFLWM